MCLILKCLIVEAWWLGIQRVLSIKSYFKKETKYNLHNSIYCETFLDFVLKS